MSLNSHPLRSLDLATATKTLLREWILTYFDGALHDVGGGVASFPDLTAKNSIVFDAGPALEPASGSDSPLQLRILIIPGRTRHFPTDEQPVGAGTAERRWAFDDVLIQCWVSVRAPDWRESNREASHAADLLFAIMRSPGLSAELTAKGIRHLRPRVPVTVANDDRATLRVLMVRAQLFYPVEW